MERCPPFPGVTQGAATLRAPLALPGVGDPSGLRVLGPTLLREAHLPPCSGSGPRLIIFTERLEPILGSSPGVGGSGLARAWAASA